MKQICYSHSFSILKESYFHHKLQSKADNRLVILYQKQSNLKRLRKIFRSLKVARERVKQGLLLLQQFVSRKNNALKLSMIYKLNEKIVEAKLKQKSKAQLNKTLKTKQ